MIDEKHVLHIEFSEAELAVRLLEATGGGERPHPDAELCLEAMPEQVRAPLLRMVEAAIGYFMEQVGGQVIDMDDVQGHG